MTGPQISRDDLPGYARREMPHDSGIAYTLPLLQFIKAVRSQLPRNGLIIASGPYGGGKTTALGVAERLFADQIDESIRLEVGDNYSGKDTLQELHYKITGEWHTGNVGQITRDLETELARAKRIIALDEAQDVPLRAIRPLRRLWGGADANYLLVLSGTNLLRELRKEAWGALASRAGAIVSFDPISEFDLIDTLGTFHPVLAATQPWILRRLDRTYTGGNWRDWAHIAQQAAESQHDGKPRGMTEQEAKNFAFDAFGRVASDWDDEDDRWDEDYPDERSA